MTDYGQYVKSLHYAMVIKDGVTYQGPPAVGFENENAMYRLADGALAVQLKIDVREPRDARALVQPTIDAWEAISDLERGWGEIRFTYERAELDYRSKPPGVVLGHLEILVGAASLHATGTVAPPVRTSYPSPLATFNLTPDARSIMDRLRRSEEGAEPTPSMAYFCLTTVEELVRARKADARLPRDEVAKWLGIEPKVLRKLGELSSERGGPAEGRKANLALLSDAERHWMRTAVRKLIRQIGIVDSGNPAPSLTMADLPPLGQ